MKSLLTPPVRMALFLLVSACTRVAPVAALDDDLQQIGYWTNMTTFQWRPVESPNQYDLTVAIPQTAKYFTVAIDDDQGRRIRNLKGMAPVVETMDFAAMMNESEHTATSGLQTVALHWNGCDDNGEPVPAGTYRVHGLSHGGLGARFDYAWYNPGTPPWQGYPNSGWLGDHSGPSAVACVTSTQFQWRVIAGCPCAEGGQNVLALNRENRVVWNFKRFWWGPTAMEVEGDILWMTLMNYNVLMKLKVEAGTPQTFRRPAGQIAEIRFAEEPKDLAVGPDRVAVLLSKSRDVLFLDKRRGKELARVSGMTHVTHLTFDPAGVLVASTPTGAVSLASDGTAAPYPIPGVAVPGPLKFDSQGRLYAMDLGPDYQIKVYSPERQFLRAIGTAGGQKGLLYDEQALHSVADLSIDEQGQVWVVETDHPRRLSAWGPDGRLVRDFIGNAQYGACNMTLHEQDPTLAAAYNILFRIDTNQVASYRPVQYLSSPGPTNGFLHYARRGGSGFERGMLFRSDVSGTMREYYLFNPNGFPILMLNRNGDYRPVAAVGNRDVCDAFPPGPDGNTKAIFIWSDANEDEQVQPEEMQHLDGNTYQLSFFYGWTYLVLPNLQLFFEGHGIPPERFTASGAPVYTTNHLAHLASEGPFIRCGNHLVGTENAGPFTVGRYRFTDLKGHLTATYPVYWTGVHGSMQSPLPAQDQTCGELFFSGVAKLGGDIGWIIASQGNMGQTFLFTEDGLFIGSLFKDYRAPHGGPGPDMTRGNDWSDCSMSQENFGGWFGRQDDGQFRCLFGRCEASVTRITGLESVARFDAGTLTIHADGSYAQQAPSAVATAPASTPRKPAAATTRPQEAGPAPLKVASLLARGHTVRVDGDLEDWASIPSSPIRSGNVLVAEVRAAYDATNLYLAWDVVDSSPLKNAGQEPSLYFKQGDCVDLMLGTNPERHDTVEPGDVRVLFAPLQNGTGAMIYRPRVPGTAPEARTAFTSPVRSIAFDFVMPVNNDTRVAFRPSPKGYTCEASIPFALFALNPRPGLRLRGDLGVLSSNDGGMITERRCYLFNKLANVVADIPTEAELTPAQWGVLELE